MRTFLLTLGVVLGVAGFLGAEDIVLQEGDTWYFLRGYVPPPTDWATTDFDPLAAGWESGPTGIGYGDDDDATVLDDMSGGYASVFLRTEISIPDTVSGGIWILRVRYDDAFVAYVDGQEIVRRGISGAPPDFDQFADAEHEIGLPSGFDETIVIPDGASLFTPGLHVLAVQVHNATLESSDLSLSAELATTPFTVESIEPDFGPVDGGNEVIITGMGFDPGDTPEVLFGGRPSPQVEVVSSGMLRVVVPQATNPGAVDVLVEDLRGEVLLVSAYRYTDPSLMGLSFNDEQFAIAEDLGQVVDQGTFEIWLRREGGGFRFRGAILAVESPMGDDAFLIELRFNQVRARSWSGQEVSDLFGGFGLEADEWHHIAFTFSLSGRRLYLDGQLRGSDDYVMQLPAGARFALCDGFGTDSRFAGLVESVRVWSVERTEQEIRRYRFARFELEPGLESSWPLLEGGGQYAENLGRSGADLILGESAGVDDADPEWTFLQDYPDLAIVSIEPSAGAIGGGNVVSLYGTGFATEPPPDVIVGGLLSPAVEVLSDWELEAVVPAGSTFGAVVVAVQTPTSVFTVQDGYSYEPENLVTVVSEGDLWDYFVATVPPPGNWAAPEFDPADELWPRGPTGIGYGDDDDATDVSSMVDLAATVYARTEWTLSGEVSEILLLRLRIRYDDGYVAYLNGTEVARAGLLGFPPLFDELADPQHEITTGVGGFDETLDITSSRDLLQPGSNVLAIEVHNTTLDSSDLSLSAELEVALDGSGPGRAFVRGDVDESGRIDIGDAVSILRLLTMGEVFSCREAGDCNDDGDLNVTDAVYLLEYLFLAGPSLPAPWPEPGPDLDGDDLPCDP